MTNPAEFRESEDGEPLELGNPGNDQQSHGSPGARPRHGEPSHASESSGPVPPSVEDCPDEDGVLVEGPSPRPAMANIIPMPTTSLAFSEKEPHPREPNEIHMTNMHDSPLPPFIQLRGHPHEPEPHVGPFRYLDPDSPTVTSEAIRRSVDSSNGGGGRRRGSGIHPASPSVLSHSSAPSSRHSDVFSHGTRNSDSHRSWSPEHIVSPRGPGDNPFQSQPGRELSPIYSSHEHPPNLAVGFPKGGPTWHGSPEMTYGNANGPPFPGNNVPAMQPPYFGQNMGSQPLQPPPQQPPLTGYQHLALKLTGNLYGFPQVTPIYRRFEALNHRLLLQLQDEIVELEQQLDEIDAADTNARAMPMGFMPASRRAENMGQGELGWQKQEVLGKIGWRLSQYNKIISSFRETQYMPTPTQEEIDDYRGFLAHGGIISDPETRFLDETNDLVSLAPVDWDEPTHEVPRGRAGDSTPTPQTASVVGSPPARPKSTVQPASKPPHRLGPLRSPHSPMYLAYAAAIAVLVPILTFVFIPGFLERMVIVLLVFSGVAAALVQSGMLARLPADRGMTDCVICAGLYGSLMAVVAGIVA